MRKKPVSLERALAGETLIEEDLTVASNKKGSQTPARATVYLPRAALKRLKQMALDHDRRINDFLQEGVDLMLAKYGQPSLKDFERK